MRRYIKLLLVTGYIAIMFTSCLGSGEEVDISAYKDAQIASFVLSNDSVPALSAAKFTIDQINGVIFNYDSLPYGTTVDKAVCTLTYHGGYTAGVQVLQEAVSDSLKAWNGTDSLDFSKPVQFTVHAYDGFNKKVYKAYVNIHQVQPDSITWLRHTDQVTHQAADAQKTISHNGTRMIFQKIAGQIQLFTSTDLQAWTKETVTGLPLQAEIMQITSLGNKLYALVPITVNTAMEAGIPAGLYSTDDGRQWTHFSDTQQITTLLGALKSDRSKPALLSAIIFSQGKQYFAAMDENGEWTQGNAVPDDFPVSAFASTNYNRLGYEYLMTATGRNQAGMLTSTVWATSNALQWAMFSREGRRDFSEREGAMLTAYDDKLFLIGGIDAAGTGMKDIYFSSDNGITWATRDTMLLFPQEYEGRGYGSIEVDTYNYIYIYGGKIRNNAKHSDEIWRGRIFRLGFGKEK
jgi:hypothetical protein